MNIGMESPSQNGQQPNPSGEDDSRDSPTDNNSNGTDNVTSSEDFIDDTKEVNAEIKPILIKSRFRVDKCDVERLDGVSDVDVADKITKSEAIEMGKLGESCRKNCDNNTHNDIDAKEVRFILNPKDCKPINFGLDKIKTRKLSGTSATNNRNIKSIEKRNKIITIICFILFLSYFAFGVYVFKQMNRKEEIQSTSHNDISKLSDLLPGITLCSSNYMNLKKLKKSNTDIVDALEMISHLNVSDDIKRYESKQILKEISRKYAETGSIADIETLTLDSNDFIEEIFCNLKWIKKSERDKLFGCSNLIKISLIKKSLSCFNLFNMKSIIASNHDHFDSDKFADRESIYFMLGIPRNEKSFDANQLIELSVDFKPNLITDPYIADDIKGSIAFHSNRYIPSGSKSAFSIKPGNVYNFYIRKEKLYHQSNCTDYIKEYLYHANKSADYRVNYNVPISREDCIDHCVSKNILERCRCWSPSLPFIHYLTNYNSNHKLVNNHSSNSYHGTPIFWCNSILNSICEYSITRRTCSALCPADCLSEDYHLNLDVVPHQNHLLINELEEDMKYNEHPEEVRRIATRVASMKEYLKSKAIIKVYVDPEMEETETLETVKPASVSIVISVLLAFNSALVLVILWITKS